MWKEFKAFLGRGNVLDLAIAVIMGAAFGKIVSTFTEGIVMPVVGLVTGGVNFADRFINLDSRPVPLLADGTIDLETITKGGYAVIRYGQLITDVINFVIVGFVMFMIARWAMSFFAKLAAETPPPAQEALLTEIRDILKEKK